MKVASGAVNSSDADAIAIPNLDLTANVGGGPFIGEMGAGGGCAGGLFDGDIIPLQRMPPQYPRDAARSGITGWVQLEVLVNADGSVRSARVIDAKPKGCSKRPPSRGAALEVQAEGGQRQTRRSRRGSQKIEFNLNAEA